MVIHQPTAIGWCGTLHHPDISHSQLETCIGFEPLDQITATGLASLLEALPDPVNMSAKRLAYILRYKDDGVVTAKKMRDLP